MSSAAWIALLWTSFAASHFLLTNARVRPKSVAWLGEDGHRLVFSLVAASIAFPNLVIALTARSDAAQWWSFGTSLPLALPLFGAMASAVALLVLSLVHRAPTLVAGAGPLELRGVLRLTRHPMMMGFALFGVTFALWSGRSTDVAFFGGLAAYALVGTWHQDRRYLRDVPGYRGFLDATTFFPIGWASSEGPRSSESSTQERALQEAAR